MYPKDEDEMANSVDPDQTAPPFYPKKIITVCFLLTIILLACKTLLWRLWGEQNVQRNLASVVAI